MALFTLQGDRRRRARTWSAGVEAVNLFDLEQRLARMGLDLVAGAPAAQKARLIGGGASRART